MNLYQRGALSLWWCALLVGLCAAIAFAALFSMRYGHNLFVEGWADLQSTPAGQMAGQTGAAAASILTGQDATVRKCTIDGAAVYSNVDCRRDNPTSRTIETRATRGIEAPKAPAAALPNAAPADDLQQKALDKAIGSQAG